jgi:hypothetical protein
MWRRDVMATSKQMIRGVDLVVKESRTPVGSWRIGITYSPEERRTELDNPPRWNFWRADSLLDAMATVDFFATREGMQRDPGGDQMTTGDPFVYVF